MAVAETTSPPASTLPLPHQQIDKQLSTSTTPSRSPTAEDALQDTPVDREDSNSPHPPLSRERTPASDNMPALLRIPQHSAIDDKPLVSQSGMLVVLSYSPAEGEEGVPIAVDIELVTAGSSGNDEPPPIKLRIVIGRTALPTTVRDLSPPHDESGNGQPHGKGVYRLRVTANAPDYKGARYPEQMSVPLTLQAIGPASQDSTIDQVIFGSFAYWESSMFASFLVHASLTDVPTDDKSSPKRPLRVKRSRDCDDFPQETGRLAPQMRAPPTANPDVLTIARPDVELSLMRTTSVPRNRTDVVEATLEWVVTDDCPDPGEMEDRNDW